MAGPGSPGTAATPPPSPSSASSRRAPSANPVHGLPDGDARCTYVKSTLEPTGTGSTLTMVETGLAQLPEAADHKVAYSGNTEGWTNEPGELVAYLDGQSGSGRGRRSGSTQRWAVLSAELVSGPPPTRTHREHLMSDPTAMIMADKATRHHLLSGRPRARTMPERPPRQPRRCDATADRGGPAPSRRPASAGPRQHLRSGVVTARHPLVDRVWQSLRGRRQVAGPGGWMDPAAAGTHGADTVDVDAWTSAQEPVSQPAQWAGRADAAGPRAA